MRKVNVMLTPLALLTPFAHRTQGAVAGGVGRGQELGRGALELHNA